MAFQYDIPFQVDLSDRVALVTGGNGGIGGMFCRALAACGATVIVLGRNLERCQKVADEINAGGGKADAISGDVTDEAAMLRVKDEIAKKYGGLNILINAGGRRGQERDGAAGSDGRSGRKDLLRGRRGRHSKGV